MSELHTGGEPLDAYRARLDGATIAMYAAAMFIVPAKISCRISVGGWSNVRLDDYLSVITLVLANGFFWITNQGLRQWLGRHVVTDVPLDEISDFLKYLIAASLTYVCAIAFIKYTILAFYWRLFSVTARIPIYVLTASVAAWQIIFLCLGLFACQPIHAQWDTSVTDAKCLHQKSVYLGGSLPNVIVDFVLVFMPIPYVWKLHASLYQRLILASMFFLGLFICIVSIIRLTIVMSVNSNDQNVTYNLKDFILWSSVEINIGLVCACLPSMRQFLKLVGLNRIFSSVRGSSRNTPGASNLPSGANASEGTRKKGTQKSGSRTGILSTITGGFHKFDSGDDGFQMIDSISKNPYGKSQSQVEGGRASVETGQSAGSKSDSDKNQTGISVQRDWSVWVDERNQRPGAPREQEQPQP